MTSTTSHRRWQHGVDIQSSRPLASERGFFCGMRFGWHLDVVKVASKAQEGVGFFRPVEISIRACDVLRPLVSWESVHQRIVEQVVDVPVVKEIKLPIKETVDVSVLQFQGETVEVNTAIPQECMSDDVPAKVVEVAQTISQELEVLYEQILWTGPFSTCKRKS